MGLERGITYNYSQLEGKKGPLEKTDTHLTTVLENKVDRVSSLITDLSPNQLKPKLLLAPHYIAMT